MSLDLRDIRIKVSVETHAWLDARSRVSGDDISSIVRSLLDQHTQAEIDVAKVADSLLRREGLPGILGEGRGA